jgi:CheY-like chemotaxis protein
MKVLLVDDINANLIMLKRLLSNNGYEVITQTNPLLALDMLSSDPSVDVVVTDYMMPELKGGDFLRLMQALPCYLHDGKVDAPPCILITAWAKEFNLQDALKNGFQAVLKKPFPNQELLDLMGTVRLKHVKRYRNVHFVNYAIRNKETLAELSAQHYRYHFSANYDEAWDQFVNGAPASLVVMREDDLEDSGYNRLIQQLTEMKPAIQDQPTPMILITGNTQTYDTANSNPAIALTLKEPVRPDFLTNIIQQLH